MLDQLVAEDYVLIYSYGATPKYCIPRFSWVNNCYQMIDRWLIKNLKCLFLVHPVTLNKSRTLFPGIWPVYFTLADCRSS